MRDYLLFQLYGPMASWGDIAVGEYRPSFAHPSKSAIMGLLAAALGIRRDEDEHHRELSEACSFAVRADAIGTLLTDYHTIQVPSTKKGITHYTRYSELAVENLNTILSKRDYRCDAAYIVAIAFRDASTHLLKKLAERLAIEDFTLSFLAGKLSTPEFVIYLGRKSCPLSLPLHPQIIKNAPSLNAALKESVFPTDEWKSFITESPFLVYWEDDVESGFASDHIIIRRDMPISRIRWQFSERHEYYCSEKKED